MKYCIHCGGELVDGARFCSSCGAPVGGGSSKSENSTAKCPQCGERIDAFVAKCPACGHELRGSQTLSRVRELEDDLEGVESPKKRSELIRNFYIPNTKEDIYEFFILATSNLKAGGSDDAAWRAKLEQAMQKARLVLGEGDDLARLTSIYRKVNKTQTSGRIIKFLMRSRGAQIAALFLIGLLLMIIGEFGGHQSGDDESPFYTLALFGLSPFIAAFFLGIDALNGRKGDE